MNESRGAQRCSCQCHWDLSWLRFGPGKISPSDVDGLFVVERNGHFLYLETKRPDEILSDGQKILLLKLSYVPRFTVLLIRGPHSYPQTVTIIKNGGWAEPEETDRDKFQLRVDAWYKHVDR